MRCFLLPLLVASTCFTLRARAEAEAMETLKPGLHYAPVVVDGRELFSVRGIQMFRADERAGLVAGKIVDLAADASFSTNEIAIIEEADRSLIMGRDVMLLTLLDDDARLIGLSRNLAAELVANEVSAAVARYRAERESRFLLIGCGRAVFATLIAGFALFLLMRLHRRVSAFIKARVVSRLEKTMKIQSFSVVQHDQLWRVFQGVTDTARLVAVFLVLYLYLQRVLNLFPWTRRTGVVLFDVLIAPLQTMALGFLRILPDLIFLVILYFVVRYLLKVIYAFFSNVERGGVQLGGFEAEWAMPTYRIVRLLVLVFAVVVAYPYIPGSSTNAFKGISVFMGVILSLGSSSLISNIMAGYSMTYRKAFKVGDRIRVGDHIGDVEEVRMMVTRLRSLKNEEVVIPNSMILGQEVVNYSALAQREGLILHTRVGIGYETSWRQVEAMLLEAAAKTSGIDKEPAPFVRQLGLGDYAVNYELNVYCRDPRQSPVIYTDLHRNIQDVFNTYGIQIMTPSYENDPAQPKIVPPSQWYVSPADRNSSEAGDNRA